MSLDEITNARTNSTFKARVESSVWKAALNIVGEAATADPKIDQKRHDLGAKVLNRDVRVMEAFIRTVSANAADGVADSTTITDATIDTSVSSVWNDIAGVQSTDT